MKYKGAVAILLTMLLSILAVAGTQLIDNTKVIEALKSNKDDIKEDVREIKSDIKYIRQRLERW